MKTFRLTLFTSVLLLLLGGCGLFENPNSNTSENCPTCNMKISDSKLFTSSLYIKNSVHTFDDIGCMILFAKNNQLDLKNLHSEVFTNDTKKYIDSKKAYYKTDEDTPMNYGFAAYEHKQDNSVSFDEVIVKMLRGENMANPKIRKFTLGNKHGE